MLALTDIGLTLHEVEPRTLVVADRESVATLLDVALGTPTSSPAADAAAIVGWWAQRAEHPGTSAVLMVISACAERWVLPAAPEAERRVDQWRRWLGVPDSSPAGLLQLAQTVSAGQNLPGLDVFREDDLRAWQALTEGMLDPASARDWRRRDSRREAAIGLASRCDAAELYASLRLADPMVATRELFSGTVVAGEVTAACGSTIELTLDHLTCRLREGTTVEGWRGNPWDAPRPGATPWLRGTLIDARVAPRSQLRVMLDDVLLRPAKPPVTVGQHITLRPRAVDPNQQRSGRHELHRRYAARRSWLSGGPPPAPQRRDVPLDVVVAAAE